MDVQHFMSQFSACLRPHPARLPAVMPLTGEGLSVSPPLSSEPKHIRGMAKEGPSVCFVVQVFHFKRESLKKVFIYFHFV